MSVPLLANSHAPRMTNVKSNCLDSGPVFCILAIAAEEAVHMCTFIYGMSVAWNVCPLPVVTTGPVLLRLHRAEYQTLSY